MPLSTLRRRFAIAVPQAVTRQGVSRNERSADAGVLGYTTECSPSRLINRIIPENSHTDDPLLWTWSGITFDLMTQIAAFLTVSLGLFVVFSFVLYFNMTLNVVIVPAGTSLRSELHRS